MHCVDRVVGVAFGSTEGCQFDLTWRRLSSQTDVTDAVDITGEVNLDDPAVGLRAAMALHRLAGRIEAAHVALARSIGWSWQQIGDALGVTRELVHLKYEKDF